LFMQMSAWGIFKNCYQQSVSHQGFGWHLVGFILFLASVFVVYAAKKDWLLFLGLKHGTVLNIITGLLAAGSLLSYSAFTWYFNVC